MLAEGRGTTEVPSLAAVLPSKVKPPFLLSHPHREVLRCHQTWGHKAVLYRALFAHG